MVLASPKPYTHREEREEREEEAQRISQCTTLRGMTLLTRPQHRSPLMSLHNLRRIPQLCPAILG